MKKAERTTVTNGAGIRSRSLAAARRKLLWCTLACVLLASACGNGRALEPDSTREYKVKIAYLYNFTRYVTWPRTAFDQPDSPFVIAVIGDDPLGSSLDLLEKRKAHGRRIVVRRFRSIAHFQPCHVLFVTRNAADRARREVVRRTAETHTLVVGESAGFAVSGGDINFFNDRDGTIGFEINVDAVKRSNLRIDAKLLSIARIVRGAGGPQF